MKFSCEKYLLLNAITTASRAAAVKSSVAALEGLLIEAGENKISVSGYDLKTGIITNFLADVTEAGSIVLSARLFSEIIRKMPDDVITVSSDAKLKTEITGGNSRFSIIGTPAEDYPELPVSDGTQFLTMKQGILKAMISQTNFAVSDNEARPIQTGTLFETENGKLIMVAVDGYRLALRREELEDGAEGLSFVVPGNALNEVEKILEDGSTVEIHLGNKHITFKFGDTVLISRRLEGDFLNYRKSVPTTGKYDLKVVKKDLITSLERVSLMINEKLKSPVRCVFTDGTVKLSSSTPIGMANDECTIEGNADNLMIGFNNKYMLDALKAAPSDEVIMRLNSGIAPCLILPPDGEDNYLYMVLPVRLKNEG